MNPDPSNLNQPSVLPPGSGDAVTCQTTAPSDVADDQRPLFPQLIALVVSSDQNFVKISDQRSAQRLAMEVQEVCRDPERVRQTLKQLLPEGVEHNDRFFGLLRRLGHRLGYTPEAHQLMVALILALLDELPEAQGEALLRKLPEQEALYFFQLLYVFPLIMADIKISPPFAAEWFVLITRKMGNDLGGEGFWNGLRAFCEKQPLTALKVQQCLIIPATDEDARVAGFLLGDLRAQKLLGEGQKSWQSIDEDFRNGSDDRTRSAYDSSWIETCHRGALTRSDFERLVSRMTSGSGNQREQVIWIITSCLMQPAIDAESFSFGMGWLDTNASGAISPNAKYQVISLANRLQPQHRPATAALILKLPPILPEHTGIWTQLEYFLVSFLQNDLANFKKFCIGFIKLNEGNWLKLLREPQTYEYFFSELQKHDVGDMVAEMIFASDWKCRKLGFLFFDKLGIVSLPKEALESASESQIQIAFHETQRNFIHAKALARFLIMLIPVVETTTTEFKSEFSSEITRQLKNYPGSFHEEVVKQQSNYPLLEKCLKDADAYFEAWRKAQTSSVHAMEIVGYRKAVYLHARRFQNEISRRADEMSIFAQFFKKVKLLYGKAWRTYHRGTLGEASGFQEISSSVEVPRLEILAPEDMALRRLNAIFKIQQLGGIEEEEQEVP